MHLTVDFETRSPVDLKTHGSHRYAQHPLTDAQCLCMTDDGVTVSTWLPKWVRDMHPSLVEEFNAIPDEALSHNISLAKTIEAHNAGFERDIWNSGPMARYGFAPIPAEKWRCSAAKAASHALPRHLEGACNALSVDQQKDVVGYKTMLRMCKPRRPRKGEDPNQIYWHQSIEDYRTLIRYCQQDVRAEWALSKALPDLNPVEQRIWHLDQKINERGILADLDACRAAIQIIEGHEADLTAELKTVTGGALYSAKQVGEFVTWARSRGVPLDNITKETVAATLARADIPADVRRALEIRQSLGRSSTSKFQAILDQASADGRVRGTLLYWGASTGRWCLAEDSPVLVKNQTGAVFEKPIQDVLLDDLVWDGSEWVAHEGVVFSGEKDVLTWDGVTATPEHVVYLSDGVPCSLGDAAELGLNIWRGEK
jgi:DNA polymerase